MTSNAKRAAVAEPETRLSIVTGSRRTLDLPTHVLRQQAAGVDFEIVSRTERWELVRGLLRALHTGPIGSGLAAPMTGVGLRVVVSTAGGDPLVMFNPRIVAAHGSEWTENEGNLCLPGMKAPVVRPYAATIEWQSINSGQQRTGTFEGWQARVLMHEIEILDGRLFVDHASSPAIGSWLPEEERARRAEAVVFGESPPSLGRSEALGLATLPRSLRALDGILTRPASSLDLDAMEPRRLRALVHSMLRIMYQQRGVGLAAPQVGLGLRLVVIDSGDEKPLALINPRIVDRDDREEVASEGCLSIPGWRGDLPRSTAVKVASDTIRGERVEMNFSGYLARVAQHEIDHINGILYTDRIYSEDTLSVTDPDSVADDMVRMLMRSQAQESRASTNRRNGGMSSAKRGGNRRG